MHFWPVIFGQPMFIMKLITTETQAYVLRQKCGRKKRTRCFQVNKTFYFTAKLNRSANNQNSWNEKKQSSIISHGSDDVISQLSARLGWRCITIQTPYTSLCGWKVCWLRRLMRCPSSRGVAPGALNMQCLLRCVISQAIIVAAARIPIAFPFGVTAKRTKSILINLSSITFQMLIWTAHDTNVISMMVRPCFSRHSVTWWLFLNMPHSNCLFFFNFQLFSGGQQRDHCLSYLCTSRREMIV